MNRKSLASMSKEEYALLERLWENRVMVDKAWRTETLSICLSRFADEIACFNKAGEAISWEDAKVELEKLDPTHHTFTTTVKTPEAGRLEAFSFLADVLESGVLNHAPRTQSEKVRQAEHWPNIFKDPNRKSVGLTMHP